MRPQICRGTGGRQQLASNPGAAAVFLPHLGCPSALTLLHPGDTEPLRVLLVTSSSCTHAVLAAEEVGAAMLQCSRVLQASRQAAMHHR